MLPNIKFFKFKQTRAKNFVRFVMLNLKLMTKQLRKFFIAIENKFHFYSRLTSLPSGIIRDDDFPHFISTMLAATREKWEEFSTNLSPHVNLQKNVHENVTSDDYFKKCKREEMADGGKFFKKDVHWMFLKVKLCSRRGVWIKISLGWSVQKSKWKQEDSYTYAFISKMCVRHKNM